MIIKKIIVKISTPAKKSLLYLVFSKRGYKTNELPKKEIELGYYFYKFDVITIGRQRISHTWTQTHSNNIHELPNENKKCKEKQSRHTQRQEDKQIERHTQI